MDFADLLKTSKRKINQEDGTKIDLKKVRGSLFLQTITYFSMYRIGEGIFPD